jgi:hypothetical protein
LGFLFFENKVHDIFIFIGTNMGFGVFFFSYYFFCLGRSSLDLEVTNILNDLKKFAILKKILHQGVTVNLSLASVNRSSADADAP